MLQFVKIALEFLTSGRAKEMSSYNQEQQSTFEWHDGAEALREIWRQGRPAPHVQLSSIK